MKKRTFYILIFFVWFLSILLYTVGYSLITGSVSFSGNAIVKAYTGRVRVTSVLVEDMNGGFERVSSYFYSTVVSKEIQLPELDSTITYRITIANETDQDKMFKGIIENVYSNTNILYTYSGLVEGNVLSPGEEVSVLLTFSYSDDLTMVPNDETLKCLLNFSFSDDSFLNLVTSIDNVLADFSEDVDYGTFSVEVTNPNDVDVQFRFYLGNTELRLYDDNDVEGASYVIGANETKTYMLYISERVNTTSDSLTIVTPLNLSTDLPENTTTVVTDMITIRLPNKAKYVILDDNTIVTNPPIFTGTHTDSGLYKSDSGLEGGVVYYYRGDVSNNYVSYAGYTWRILQLDDHTNVRLILEGSIGSSGWVNSDDVSSLSSAIKILDYDNGLVKLILEEWYKTNIESNSDYLSLIRESKFCLDMSYETRISSGSSNLTYYFGPYIRVGIDSANYNPEFTCDEKYLRSYSIGMIGADEISYAGGYFNTVNYSFFLRTNNVTIDTWSISPSYYDPTLERAGMFLLTSQGNFCDWTSQQTLTTARGIRPVITLDGSLIISGDGTKTSPYIFGVDN